MNPVIFYYYWNNHSLNAWSDWHSSPVLSIATLRYFDQTVPVIVIDASDDEKNWSDYPAVLNFRVVRKTPLYKTMAKQRFPTLDWAEIYYDLLSKTMDIYEVSSGLAESPVIVSDTDLFWVKSPFPLEADWENKFCVNRNSGFYYYDRNVAANHDVMMIWTSLCTQVMQNELFADRILRSLGVKHLQEENVLRYILDRFPHYFSMVPWYENCALHYLHDPSQLDPTNAKNIHVHGNTFNMGRERKAWICLAVSELRDIVTEVLGIDRVASIFGDLSYESFSMFDRDRIQRISMGA